MSLRTTAHTISIAYLLGGAAKSFAVASAVLLALPIDVTSVEGRQGQEPVAHQFCIRNPHSCAAVGELHRELKLRAVAVRELVAAAQVK